eukprot:3245097-Amphidinium_carterae.2
MTLEVRLPARARPIMPFLHAYWRVLEGASNDWRTPTNTVQACTHKTLASLVCTFAPNIVAVASRNMP